MEYRIEIWSIKDLVEKYNDSVLSLNPPYQRRFIWSIRDQQTLIDSILRGYAIPNIFLHEYEPNKYEMVDGQQRTRTILGFIKGEFKTSDEKQFTEKEFGKKLNKYLIPVTIIEKIDAGETIEEFYALVNKSGIHLNRPELKKAEHFDTKFLKLATELADSKEFKSLGLFTERSSKRMTDLDFVSELIAQIKVGITDKKLKVDQLFEKDIDNKEFKELKTNFQKIMKVFTAFNKIKEIKYTRYKQRNDFYTLFGFVSNNLDLPQKDLNYIYELLVEFNNDIIPSNEECEPFQLYAFHCISQSNSKSAREERLKILENLFMNSSTKPNSTQKKVLKYLKLTADDMVEVSKFLMFDLKSVKKSKLDLQSAK